MGGGAIETRGAEALEKVVEVEAMGALEIWGEERVEFTDEMGAVVVGEDSDEVDPIRRGMEVEAGGTM